MSTTEQDKVIEALRSKAVKIEFNKKPKTATKIDKQKVWALAERVGKSISDDSLSAPHPSGA